MEFFKKLQQIDKSKDNRILTIVSGKNMDSKLLLSNGEIVYTNNNKVNWQQWIDQITQNSKSQIITVGDEKAYMEFLTQKYNVVICGAGHISMPIISMCKLLDLPVTVIDDRISFANNARNTEADLVICEPFDSALDQIDGDNGTFFVIVTRGHRYDQICLQKIIQKENAYIGMIGSKVRVAKVLDYLEEEGIDREKLNKVYTPIGLKIGSETPAEIAVSIMAQIIEVKNKKIGTSTYSKEIMNHILDEEYQDMPKALITIVSRRGSAPREVGTKMLVLKDGTMIGTIGGGCVEADIRQSAFSCIDSGESKLVKADMTGEEAEDDGMVCGGIVELFVEIIK
ncbi:xanthine dehydrogenase accessory factor [Alkalibaculum bacchi]|uniref:Xanthine dehydrogenase accessory factor n=1 Tax=Alkalibaculum bacchi TaxID=645887 RepID=A0A366I1T1_9FIRM|nr:XdhC/CoxI family protein [Alkalibaculum bacchi]RBP61362.1 xanthine dehydrogenase accessory factor [Alkalibaculum bacchi]